MSAIYVRGIGAVSPAGWGVQSLCDAIQKGEPLPVQELPRPSAKPPHRARLCPPLPARPAWLAHPRLRRSSPVSQFAMAAALEAAQVGGLSIEKGCAELGIIVAAFSGCVQYSRRFYQEVLTDPSTASPLIFPETVFNAPASHLGAYLNCAAANYTLVGDTGTFLTASAIAANWIQTGKVKHCLVVGTEEADWLTAEGLHIFLRKSIMAEGAGAILLSSSPQNDHTAAVQLAGITDEVLFATTPRREALNLVRHELAASSNALLADGSRSSISPCQNAKMSLNEILGEGLMAGSAWTVCLAVQALLTGAAQEASVIIEGLHQHAIGAKFQTINA